MPNSFRKTLPTGLVFEKYAHIVAGAAMCVLSVVYSHHWFTFIVAQQWDYGAIYSSIFDLATVYSALLFGFVGYFRTVRHKFIEALPERLYWGSIRYAEHGFALGMTLMLVSIPLIVIQPRPEASFDLWSFVFGLWAFLAVSAIIAFVRASQIFWTLMRATSVR